jgi:hypothetical protein
VNQINGKAKKAFQYRVNMLQLGRHTFGGLGFFDVGGGRDAMITDKKTLTERVLCAVLAGPNLWVKVISLQLWK